MVVPYWVERHTDRASVIGQPRSVSPPVSHTSVSRLFLAFPSLLWLPPWDDAPLPFLLLVVPSQSQRLSAMQVGRSLDERWSTHHTRPFVYILGS